MANPPDQTQQSLWMATAGPTSYTALRRGGLKSAVDVVVVGGGIAGLTTALLLKLSGKSVTLVEAGRVASATTGNTTAKITSLHGLIYSRLSESHGQADARLYAEANQLAIEGIAQLVDTYQIACDFQRASAFSYSESSEMAEMVRDEVVLGNTLGLGTEQVAMTELPYKIEVAVELQNQALFHPRKYCLALAKLLDGDGCRVIENTRALEVKDEPGHPIEVTTARGPLYCQHLVVTSQAPFIDGAGGYFARTHAETSYAVAVRLKSKAPAGMYLSVDTPGRSLRPHPALGDDLLIVGGEGHKTGQEDDTESRYAALEAWAKDRFPVASVEYRWSAEDFLTLDGIPYIGKLGPGSPRAWVATGFGKWGMTTSMVAAWIISDGILGRENRWSALFSPQRLETTGGIGTFVKENVNVATHFVGDRLTTLAPPKASDLAAGQGGLVDLDGERVAAYRDEDGALHAVSAVCTHLACLVGFNDAQRSWDCPCHGSRFDIDGHVLQGPAVRDLEAKGIAAPKRPQK